MTLNDILGTWRVAANNFPGDLRLWRDGSALAGVIKFGNGPVEALQAVAFANDQLQFNRPGPAQRYTGQVRGDEIQGQFTEGSNSFPWSGWRVRPLPELASDRPRARSIDFRAGLSGAPCVLIVVEERILGTLTAGLNNGVSLLSRFLDDLQNEGWEVAAYSYDVRSHESGERCHRHLPSEFLDLYRFVRQFYEVAQGALAGLLLAGDFPAAGIVGLGDLEGGTGQQELDYFGADAVLADPNGYWDQVGAAPMVPPGSSKFVPLPWDESRAPYGALYLRDQWSAPGFVAHLHRKWQVNHAERSSQQWVAEPKFWVGRITAAQSAWRTGQGGLEYSESEEMRLLVEYFHRNHQYRTTRDRVKRGYVFVDLDWAGSWATHRASMANAVPQANIVVNADTAPHDSTHRATVANYVGSFNQDFQVCHYIMHGDAQNHYFTSPPNAPDSAPANFPQSFTSPGSAFSVAVPGFATSVKALHHFAMPNRAPSPRFYLLGGCGAGDILHRPRGLVDVEKISAVTPLHRQHGAQNLGVTYLMRCNGLAVLAHNTVNQPGDCGPIYQAWQQGKCMGEGVLQIMRNENVVGGIPNPYRNIVFGDPTLRLSY